MKPKFKIGDRVKLKGFNEIWIIHRIDLGLKDGYANYHLSEDKINSINIANAKCNELKLVETREEIAVKKALKEFKSQFYRKLRKNIKDNHKASYGPFGYGVCKGCITNAEILKLLESEDK